MDTLTHALLGALVARATAPRERSPDALPLGRRVFVGTAAAAFPDLDFITSYLTPLAYLRHHRGVTHSLVMLPLWTVLVATIFAAIWRFRPSWRAYLGVTAICIASHIATDIITAFGTMIFAPLSDARYALSTTFIIDLWFTGIIVAGLIASAVWRNTRAPAAAGLAVLAGYVGLQWMMQQQAIDFGARHALDAGLRHARVTAMPRPVSPLNWTVFVEDGGRYRYAHVNLFRKTAPPERGPDSGLIARLDAPYRPLHDAMWIPAGVYGATGDEIAIAREAYMQPSFQFFRWFAAYPALLRIDAGNPERCVWFHDLRFVTPGRAATPFQYGMCREAQGAWQPFQLLGDRPRPVF